MSASITSVNIVSALKAHGRDAKWLYGFMIVTCLLQVALVPSALYPIRTFLRAGLFGGSILMLLAPLGSRRTLPVTACTYAVLGLLVIALVNPNTNSPIAGIAAIGLNLAIIAPVLWVSRLNLKSKGLHGMLLLFWAFEFASSIYGVLEVQLPGRFSRQSSVAESQGSVAEGLKITLADGTRIYRPMGLTDSPGGACRSGFFAVLLGTFFQYNSKKFLVRGLYLASIVCGLFCIYLSQVRSMLILIIVCEIVVFFMFFRRGETRRVISMATLLSGMAVIATVWAFTVGGEQVYNRIATLRSGSASEVYYSNRGMFLEDTFYNKIPDHPLGAGLGRWGMVYVYFGDKSLRAAESLYAEIQPTAWIYDGGVPLLIAYYLSVIICCQFAYRVAAIRRDNTGDMAVIIFAYNIAMLVNTFSYIPFISQSGLYFWLLNAGLMTVVLSEKEDLGLRWPGRWQRPLLATGDR